MMNLLEIKSLELAYGSKKVVGPVMFSIQENEAFALVGESGSGKTTIALDIMNVLRFKKGKRLGGEIFFNFPPDKVAYIPQDPAAALDPLFSIGSQIRELGCSPKEIEEVLRKVKLPLENISLKSYPHELSGGMLQRLLIAMALVKKPKLLIADEPTSSLDLLHQREIIKLFGEVKAQGISILYITHNLPLAMELCSRVAVLYQGNIIEMEDTKKLYQNPKASFTNRLLKAVPVLEK